MSLSAAVIEALVSKGLSAQDILDVAKASEVKTDRTAAERQARHRAKGKKRNAVTSRRDPPIEDNHTPGDISPDGENHPVCARDADWPDLPDWLPPVPWNAYLEMRREKRAWPTAEAVGLLVGKLGRWRDKGHDPTAILNNSTECNWTGIFEPRTPANDRQHSPNQRPSTRQSGEAVAARFAATSGSAANLVPRLGSPGGHDPG